MAAWGLVEAQDSLFKRSRVPMLSVDEHGYILDINDAAIDFLELADPSQSGLNLMSTIDIADRTKLFEMLRRTGPKADFEQSVTIRRTSANTTVRVLGAAPTRVTGKRYARQIALFDLSRQRTYSRPQPPVKRALPQITTVGA